jgi:hypothetical protein
MNKGGSFVTFSGVAAAKIAVATMGVAITNAAAGTRGPLAGPGAGPDPGQRHLPRRAHHHAGETDHAMAMAMPVFAGQKLVVVGGSSGMGRQTEDVVAAGGSAVIIGADPQPGPRTRPAPDPGQRGRPVVVATPIYERFVPADKLEETPVQLRRPPPARPHRHRPRPGQHHRLPAAPGHQLGHRRHLGTSAAASWPDATNHPRRPIYGGAAMQATTTQEE